jgi:hypothetical protein
MWVIGGRDYNGNLNDVWYSDVLTSSPVASFTASSYSGLPPLDVQFTDTSTPGDEPITGYYWDFGDGTTSTIQNPSHTFTQFGDIHITMTITDAASWTSSSDAVVAVHKIVTPPLADFTATPLSGKAPLTVQFNDTSLNSPTSWVWDFGDSGNETNTGCWTRMTASAGWSARHSHGSVVMPDGTILLMGGSDGAAKNDVWRSTDYGATWTLVNANAGWAARSEPSTAVMPDGTIVVIGGSSGGHYVNDVWQSHDQGVTWICVNASTGWTPRDSLAIVVASDGSIIVSGGTLQGGYTQFSDVWRSVDGGVSWTQMKPNDANGWSPRYGHRTVLMPDGSIVLTGGYTFGTGRHQNDVWQSTDKGATWTLVNASAGWAGRILHTCVVMPDGSIVLMGGAAPNSVYFNDIWRSTDNGATWTRLPDPGWVPRFAHTSVLMPDGSIVLMGGWNGSERNDV